MAVLNRNLPIQRRMVMLIQSSGAVSHWLRRFNQHIFRLYAIGVPVIMLSGCIPVVGSVDEVDQWLVDQRKIALERVSVPPLPEIPEASPLVQVQAGNVFDPQRALPNVQQTAATLDPRLTLRFPLYGAPIEQLMFTGVFAQGRQRVALIRYGNKMIKAHAGDYIGLKGGRIVDVTEQSVHYVEDILNESGKWTKKMGKLELHAGEKHAG